jgi:hypothetical protein
MEQLTKDASRTLSNDHSYVQLQHPANRASQEEIMNPKSQIRNPPARCRYQPDHQPPTSQLSPP